MTDSELQRQRADIDRLGTAQELKQMISNIVDASQRIQEAHGLWELQVARLAGLTEALSFVRLDESLDTRGTYRQVLIQASIDERAAFQNWQAVSRECGA